MDDRDHFDKIFRSSFEDMDKIINEMDSVLRHFAFGGFSIMDSENFNNNDQLSNNFGQIKKPEENNNSLRDQYIKKNNEAFDSSKNKIFPKSFFDEFFKHQSILPEQSKSPILNKDESTTTIENFDEDLDTKILKQQKELQPKESFNFNHQPKFFSQSKSMTVRRIQRPDGSIEETTTTRDSSGKEETRVTRIIGDKSHSFINRIESDGSNETEEIFQNFDEKQIDDFNNDWNDIKANKKRIFSRIPFYNEEPILQNPPLPNSNDVIKQQSQQGGLFSKIFSWFK